MLQSKDTGWMEKQEPKIFCLQEICLTAKDTRRLKVEGWKEKIHVIENDKKKKSRHCSIHIRQKTLKQSL